MWNIIHNKRRGKKVKCPEKKLTELQQFFIIKDSNELVLSVNQLIKKA